MKWRLEFDDRQPLLTVVTADNFSVSDHRSLIAAILEHPQWQTDMNCLFDHRTLSFANICYRDMVDACRIHEACRTSFGAGKLALLMGTQASFGMGRMFETLMSERSDINIRVFLFATDAREWLQSSAPAKIDLTND